MFEDGEDSMKATVNGKVRKHVPDFPLVTEQGPVVVDLKPLRRVAKAEVAFTFDWVRQAVELRNRASSSGVTHGTYGP
ncbi:hypothetical protein ACWGJB_40115 [Streptomyces sp. NPDC054813]